MSNPIEHYILMQVLNRPDSALATWLDLHHQRFALNEMALAFDELSKKRQAHPDSKFRLVSITVALLNGEVSEC